MLDGSFTVKVDEKGRVKVPADFRRDLAERFGPGDFFVTSIKADCALIYPSRAWETIQENISKEPPSNDSIRKFRRATSYFGQRASMDPQGRILIHPRLRVEVGIEDDVLIIGQPNHLEVWNRARFRSTLAEDPVTKNDEDYLSSFGI